MSAANDEPRIFQPGDRFRQYPYRIHRFIGSGASGQVYEAHHIQNGHARAIKVGHAADLDDPQKAARRLVEARATFSIDHPNVVRVFDLGVEPDGLVWQMMELLEGTLLADVLRRCRRLNPVYALDVVLEIAAGLQAAHELQIIHRDLRPENVIITSRGVVKIIDFSIAKANLLHLRTTRCEGLMGTPGYMAPEQIRRSVVPGPESDVYSLGILLWVLLTGRHPFAESLQHANVAVLIERHLSEDPEPLVTAAGLPAYVDEVVGRAAARDVLGRYAGMWPLIQALGDLRGRLLADPRVADLLDPSAWEREHPVLRGPEGYQLQAGPRPWPRTAVPAPVPSAPVVVAMPAPSPGRRAVAATVPMPAMDAAAPAGVPPPPPPRSTAERVLALRTQALPAVPTIPPPTVRSLRGERPRRPWALFVAPPLLLLAGVGAWLLLAGPDGARSASGAARAPATSAPAGPQRAPAPRSK